MIRAARQAAHVARTPLYVRPGHFYSPIVSPEDARRVQESTRVEGVDLRLEAQKRLARELDVADLGPRWKPGGNTMFSQSDAQVYAAMLRRYEPKRIIEIGSGFSTAVALDTTDCDVRCIEPFPDRLRSVLLPDDDIAIDECFVQQVAPEEFDVLDRDDVLFIDSTHVAKAGSDLCWLFFEILPRLRPGVLVHLHDIQFPFEYRADWRERSWNEVYLLRAFLMHNDAWEVLLWPAQLAALEAPEYVGKFSPVPSGSFWMRRR